MTEHRGFVAGTRAVDPSPIRLPRTLRSHCSGRQSAVHELPGLPMSGGSLYFLLGSYFSCIDAWIAATVSFRASAGLICKNSLPFVAAGT
jgi:hypothetical protein